MCVLVLQKPTIFHHSFHPGSSTMWKTASQKVPSSPASPYRTPTWHGCSIWSCQGALIFAVPSTHFHPSSWPCDGFIFNLYCVLLCIVTQHLQNTRRASSGHPRILQDLGLLGYWASSEWSPQPLGIKEANNGNLQGSKQVKTSVRIKTSTFLTPSLPML